MFNMKKFTGINNISFIVEFKLKDEYIDSDEALEALDSCSPSEMLKETILSDFEGGNESGDGEINVYGFDIIYNWYIQD